MERAQPCWSGIASVRFAVGIGGSGSEMRICLNNLTLAYDRHPVVHHLTATIAPGELLAVVGPNGAGKSTLLNTLAGLSPIHEGSIEGLCPDQVAYLPQQPRLDDSFPISVLELVASGLWPVLGANRSVSGSSLQKCVAAIDTVGLQGFEDRPINSLSGGQLQRTLFARVLLQDRPVILLDEPFNAIDARTMSDLTQVIRQWQVAERVVIIVTHDLDYVRSYCSQTLLLARACIAHGSTASVLTPANLKKARRHIEAYDENASWCVA